MERSIEEQEKIDKQVDMFNVLKNSYDYNMSLEEDNDGNLEVDIFLPIDTLQMSERNYNEYQILCGDFEDKVDGKASCMYDVGSYSYWTENQEESNYAIVAIPLKNLVDATDEEIDSIMTEVDNLLDDIIDLYDVNEESEE